METHDATDLITTAAAVAARHEEHTAALAAEQAAQVELLRRVFEGVRPGLAAVSSRIRIGYRSWWVGTTRTEDATTYATGDAGERLRGLCLTDVKPGPGRYNPSGDQNRGTYGGSDVFLLPDLRLLELSYQGSWSVWQGEGDSWGAEVRPLTLDAFVSRYQTAEEAPAAIAAAFARELAGKKTERTKAALERVARLEAVVALLKGGR